MEAQQKTMLQLAFLKKNIATSHWLADSLDSTFTVGVLVAGFVFTVEFKNKKFAFFDHNGLSSCDSLGPSFFI